MGTPGCSAPALLVSTGGNSRRDRRPQLSAHIKGAPLLAQCLRHLGGYWHVPVQLGSYPALRHSQPPPCLGNGHIPKLIDRYVEQVRELGPPGVIVRPIEDS